MYIQAKILRLKELLRKLYDNTELYKNNHIKKNRIKYTHQKVRYFTLVNDTNDTGGIVGRYPPEWVTPIEISD